MPVSAVTFDAGGTLIRPWPSVGELYARAAQQAGFQNVSAASLEARFRRFWLERRDFQHRRADWRALVDAVFEGLVPAAASAAFFDELYAGFERPEWWRVYGDAQLILDRLANRGIRLGLISNWDERLRPLLNSLRLSGYFDSIVISCEVGFLKPSPVIFEQAARQLGLAPRAILHVGDSQQEDVAGAANAGFQSLWLDRSAQCVAPGAVSSLERLEALVGA